MAKETNISRRYTPAALFIGKIFFIGLHECSGNVKIGNDLLNWPNHRQLTLYNYGMWNNGMSVE